MHLLQQHCWIVAIRMGHIHHYHEREGEIVEDEKKEKEERKQQNVLMYTNMERYTCCHGVMNASNILRRVY